MPMTTVYIASTAGANAASIAAASRAAAAQDAACAALMDSFTSQGATLIARQTYAECVQRLNPPTTEETANDKFFVGFLLLAVLIGAVAGAIKLDDSRFIGGIMGAVLGVAGAVVSLLIFAALAFIAS